MKNYLLILIIILLISASCGQNTKKTNNTVSARSVKNMVVKNVSVITMQTNEVINNKDVVIKEGKIISISDTQEKEFENMYIVDGRGKYIMPSLSDAHVHLPETEEEMERIMQLYLINGVTKLRSMRGSWEHIEWRNTYNNPPSIYPQLYLSPPAIGRNYDLTATQSEKLVKSAKEKGFDFFKILSIQNQEIFRQLNAACKKNNMPLGGHFPSNVADSIIFSSNYTSFEHLGGLVGKIELLENRLQKIKEKNIFICPTLSWYSIGSGRYSYKELRNQPGMKFISKTTIDNWISKTKQYREKLGNQAYKDEVVSELKILDEKYRIIKKLNELKVKMLLSPDSSSKYMVAGFGIVGEMKLLKNADLINRVTHIVLKQL